MKELTLCSLFDGSGGFPLAASMCGITPVFASEVEPYPIAVTRSRFPNMIHLGDVSKVCGHTLAPIDVVTFGSPCQSLSVAGKREGLRHTDNGDDETTRSGLFIEAVRIIKEMREATNGMYPTFAVWENVPGAFSSSGGADFQTVLEKLAQIKDPNISIPQPDRWLTAGEIVGDGFSIAWRTIDAQYFGKSVRDRDSGDVLVRGTPQRRRRIYLVADFAGQRAGKILFEREGKRGDSPSGGTPWQATAADAERCVGADDRAGESAYAVGIDPHNGAITYDITSTIGAHCGLGTGRNGIIERVRGLDKEQHLFENHSQDTRFKGPLDVSPMLPAQLGTGGNNTPFVVEKQPVYCLQGNGIDRADTAGCNGKGWTEDVSYTLNTIDRPAVSYDERVWAIGNGQVDQTKLDVIPGALNCMHDQQAVLIEKRTPIAIDRAFFNQGKNAQYDPQTYEDGTVPTIVAKGPSAVCHEQPPHYIVRRLTPTECARLQGFPDEHGHPDIKTELTDEEYAFWLGVRNTHAEINGKPQKNYTREQMLKWYNSLHTDSAEYKMWGNGIALPCAVFVMQGIAEELKKQKQDLKG